MYDKCHMWHRNANLANEVRFVLMCFLENNVCNSTGIENKWYEDGDIIFQMEIV